MKTLKTTAIVLGLMAFLAGSTETVKAQNYYNQGNNYNSGQVTLQTFYDELSPYGVWFQDPQYGYVWRPDVNHNQFRPYYTNGRWAMTEYGNTWVSNYDWGWAPFHYGRWVYNNYREWIWLPDTQWGPAWVDWRSGDGYYGWAPMAPGINININIGARNRYVTPMLSWNFVPYGNIYSNSFSSYNYGRNSVYFRNTTIINHVYVYNNRNYYGGPRIDDIRRYTGRNVHVYNLNNGHRPGASYMDNRSLTIYRPMVTGNNNGRNYAPTRFESRNVGIGRSSSASNNRGNAVNSGRMERSNNIGNNAGGRNVGTTRSNNSVERGNSQAQRNERIERGDRGGTFNNPSNNGTLNRGERGTVNRNFNEANTGTPRVERNNFGQDNRNMQMPQRTQTAPQVNRSNNNGAMQRVERSAAPRGGDMGPFQRSGSAGMERMSRGNSGGNSTFQRSESRQSAPQMQRSSRGESSRGSGGEGGGRPSRGN